MIYTFRLKEANDTWKLPVLKKRFDHSYRATAYLINSTCVFFCIGILIVFFYNLNIFYIILSSQYNFNFAYNRQKRNLKVNIGVAFYWIALQVIIFLYFNSIDIMFSKKVWISPFYLRYHEIKREIDLHLILNSSLY